MQAHPSLPPSVHPSIQPSRTMTYFRAKTSQKVEGDRSAISAINNNKWCVSIIRLWRVDVFGEDASRQWHITDLRPASALICRLRSPPEYPAYQALRQAALPWLGGWRRYAFELISRRYFPDKSYSTIDVIDDKLSAGQDPIFAGEYILDQVWPEYRGHR